MTVMDKARNTAQELAGLKKLTGRATGDRGLAAEGRAEETGGQVKQAGEHAKDAFRP